ncbi:MAG: beta-galactosidase [Candidatus Lokiarchaeota archaeon]|nr:beta-galactosidase [Candidatus Lokiarchaeota archaeon]
MVNNWSPITDEIVSRWTKDIDPENPLPEYPRPQLKREEWLNLNGMWDYAILPRETQEIKEYDGKILVPYPIESALSGIKKKLLPDQRLWYHRKFTIPEKWINKRIFIHFGAIDWEANIWINNNEAGYHRGGYTPFKIDITDFLNQKDQNEIIIAVWDPSDKDHQSHGKQSLKPKFITYTPSSGIWQTVWLEPTPNSYINSIKMIPDIDKNNLILNVEVHEPGSHDKIHTTIFEENKEILSIEGNFEQDLLLNLPSPKLWSPENPFLYDITISLIRNNEKIDKIKSYFGMRKISLGKSENDIRQIELNNKPIFQYGTLDQGYWPDGLYTAPTDEALKYDIEITKELGFNMIRKHVKVEPARWYYHCDKLGILVWQDMPNGEKWTIWHHLKMILLGKKYKGKRSTQAKIDFYEELESLIKNLYNSPSIVTWVPFNEGWGQFDTIDVVKKIRKLDTTRLLDNASGWFDRGVGDIRDIHHYPEPKMPEKNLNRAAVVGEFGGLGMSIKEHMWNFKRKFAYKSFQNKEEMFKSYKDLIINLKDLIKKGLSAAIYTQTTDVEQEINGLLTYDRDIIKMDKERVRELNLSLF